MPTPLIIFMAPLAFLAAALAAVSTQAYEIRRSALATRGLLATEVLPQAQYSLPLSGKTTRPKAKQDALQNLHKRSSNYTAVIAGGQEDQVYLTDITIGGQDFKVIVDTGS